MERLRKPVPEPDPDPRTQMAAEGFASIPEAATYLNLSQQHLPADGERPACLRPLRAVAPHPQGRAAVLRGRLHRGGGRLNLRDIFHRITGQYPAWKRAYPFAHTK